LEENYLKKNSLKYWLDWNKITDIGPKRFYKLLEYFGSVDTAWQAKSGEISKILNLNSKYLSGFSKKKTISIPNKS